MRETGKGRGEGEVVRRRASDRGRCSELMGGGAAGRRVGDW